MAECEGGVCEARYANIVHEQQKLYARNRLAWLRENDPERYYAGEWEECEDLLVDASLGRARALRERPVEIGDYTHPDDGAPLPNIPGNCHVTRTVWDEELGEWMQTEVWVES